MNMNIAELLVFTTIGGTVALMLAHFSVIVLRRLRRNSGSV